MITNAGNRFARGFVVLVLTAATGGMVLVSLRANYLFGYSFGQTADKAAVFGWANVAADLWKVTGLIVIAALWRATRRALAISLVPIWLLCVLWGMTGAVGVYAQDRIALIGGREANVATYRESELQLKDVEAKLQAIGAVRGVRRVDAAIDALLARPITVGERVIGNVGKLSANCTNGDRRTADVCAEIATLKEERAAAVEVEQLEERRKILRFEVGRAREAGGSTSPDPVSELFAWLSRGRLSAHDIGLSFPLAFALLVEIVSAFGPAAIVAYVETSGHDMTRRVTPHPATSSSAAPGRDMVVANIAQVARVAVVEHEQGSVLSWLAERGRPTAGAMAISSDDLYADYEVWCLDKSVRALTRDAFIDEFDHVRQVPELANKIRKFGTRYFGIAFVNGNNRRAVYEKQLLK